MDKDKTFEFISLIQERPQLWQKQHRDFMNRDIRTKMFNELAQSTGISEDMCKKKLKNLKDKMREVTSKWPKTKSGQPAFVTGEEFVRWPFYKALLLMKDQFVGRDLSGSFHEGNGKDNSIVSSAESDEETLPATQAIPSTSSAATTTPPGPTPRHSARAPQTQTKRARMAEEFLSLEREKMNSMKKIMDEAEKPKGEWDTFCSSIACDLRKITDPFLIMQVKSHINKTISDTVLQQLQQNIYPTATTQSVVFGDEECYRTYERM